MASSSSPSEYSNIPENKIHSSGFTRKRWGICTIVALIVVVVLTHQSQSNNRSPGSLDKNKSSSTTSSTRAYTRTKSKNKKRPIRQVSILGERNSGTRWIISHLQECFNHSLVVNGGLTRYKHWFQDPHAHVYEYQHDTLVIAQFRNPYDWLNAMRMVPHHSPSHMYLEWHDFLIRPWTTERIGADLKIKNNFKECQQNFTYNEINSCVEDPLPKEAYKHKLHFSEHQPFYELRHDGSGKPYDNIMELRSDKIRNFLSVGDYDGVSEVWITQYEYLQSKGTKELLDAISKVTGVPYRCDPVPIQVRRKRKLPKEFVQHVNEHLDWEAEALVGYTQDFQQFLAIIEPKKKGETQK